MKRIWLLLLCLCLALPAAALGDNAEPVMLYSASFATMQVTGGMYVPLTMQEGFLRSGPGDMYSNVGNFTMNHREVHCYTLAYDEYGEIWVMVDFAEPITDWRGYIRLSKFDADIRTVLLDALPYEASYDQLTPDMIAQLYNDCAGLWGPGDSYDQLAYLPVDVTEGTLILTQGEWGLLELNEYTLECIDAYAPMRVWVKLGNCFY